MSGSVRVFVVSLVRPPKVDTPADWPEDLFLPTDNLDVSSAAQQVSYNVDGTAMRGHKTAPAVPNFNKSTTEASLTSGMPGSATKLEQLRQDHQSKIRRSTTALSSLSCKTGGTYVSEVPAGVEVGTLRGMHSVLFNTQWPVQEDYDFVERLGEGGFGQVWRATEKATSNEVAIKIIPAVTMKDVFRYERELKVFERLSSPYAVKLHTIFKDEEKLYLVMDLCKGGDLMEYLLSHCESPEHDGIFECADGGGMLPDHELGPIVWQMLAGVLYMHHHRFAHRDIKLENYMLKEKTKQPRLQLCDFGLSIRIDKGQKIKGGVGTVMYMPPEVISGTYDLKCDIWSVGVSAYVVANMGSPWGQATEPGETRRRILANERAPWLREEVSSQMRSLVDLMMTFDHEKRPSAKALFNNSEWLQKQGAPLQLSEKLQSSRLSCAIA